MLRSRRNPGLALTVCLLIPTGVATAGGDLRLTATRAGHLSLVHAEGWETSVAFEAGEKTLWDLPTGLFHASLNPVIRATEIVIYPHALTTIHLTGDEIRVADPGERTIGCSFQISPHLWSALPGSKEQVLAALDTHTRLRPGASLGALSTDIAVERRELLPGQRVAMGAATLALSPTAKQGDAHRWHLSTGTPSTWAAGDTMSGPRLARPQSGSPWPVVFAGVRQNSLEGTIGTAHVGLLRLPFTDFPARGEMTIHFAHLGDADPRMKASKLPHNDADQLDLTAHLDIGPVIPEDLETATMGLSLDLLARGWQRNYFLEAYRYNAEHAPQEETANLQGRATFLLRRPGGQRAEVWVGYERYLTWLGDGVYGDALGAYGPLENAGIGDEIPRIYWPGRHVEETPGPGIDNEIDGHVYDYFVRKFSSALSGGFLYAIAPGTRTRLGLRGETSAYTYKRYEHFAPIHLAGGTSQAAYANAWHVGYNDAGETSGEGVSDPGRLVAGRADLWGEKALNQAWRLEASAGGHWLKVDGQELVSLETPFQGRAEERLLPEDLRATNWKITPEAQLGLRGTIARGVALWGLGYRAAHLPPLEALFSPEAQLGREEGILTEGAIGNPGLAPEVETGFEFGAGRTIRLGSYDWHVQAAGYGALLDDAITMVPAYIGDQGTLNFVPIYENGGRLRQWGFHTEARTGDVATGRFLRCSYDYARIESDVFEAPLLDARWVYPERPQGEYESEGYAGALGGIHDEFDEGDPLEAGVYKLSNLDRTHRLSAAIVLRSKPPSAISSSWFAFLTKGWTTGMTLSYESGRPFTQTLVHFAGLLPKSGNEADPTEDPAWKTIIAGARNDERMAGSFFLDLAFTRMIPLADRNMVFSIEALNVLAMRNTNAVYRATGETDDDGALAAYGSTPQDIGTATYLARLENPRNYERPFVVRIGVGLEVL